VCVQIFIALLFKSAMWYLYLGEFDEKVKTWRRYKASDWLSECYTVEFLGRRRRAAILTHPKTGADRANPRTS
jgi:hypothetical protein